MMNHSNLPSSMDQWENFCLKFQSQFGKNSKSTDGLVDLCNHIAEEIGTLDPNDTEKIVALFLIVKKYFINFWWKINWKNEKDWRRTEQKTCSKKFEPSENECLSILLRSLIYLGVILSDGDFSSSYLDTVFVSMTVLTSIDVVYDALLSIKRLKKRHRVIYVEILKHVLLSSTPEKIDEPLTYAKVIMLFRILKHHAKDDSELVSAKRGFAKIEPPRDFLAWLQSTFGLDVGNLKLKKLRKHFLSEDTNNMFVEIRKKIINKDQLDVNRWTSGILDCSLNQSNLLSPTSIDTSVLVNNIHADTESDLEDSDKEGPKQSKKRNSYAKKLLKQITKLDKKCLQPKSIEKSSSNKKVLPNKIKIGIQSLKNFEDISTPSMITDSNINASHLPEFKSNNEISKDKYAHTSLAKKTRKNKKLKRKSNGQCEYVCNQDNNNTATGKNKGNKKTGVNREGSNKMLGRIDESGCLHEEKQMTKSLNAIEICASSKLVGKFDANESEETKTISGMEQMTKSNFDSSVALCLESENKKAHKNKCVHNSLVGVKIKKKKKKSKRKSISLRESVNKLDNKSKITHANHVSGDVHPHANGGVKISNGGKRKNKKKKKAKDVSTIETSWPNRATKEDSNESNVNEGKVAYTPMNGNIKNHKLNKRSKTVTCLHKRTEKAVLGRSEKPCEENNTNKNDDNASEKGGKCIAELHIAHSESQSTSFMNSLCHSDNHQSPHSSIEKSLNCSYEKSNTDRFASSNLENSVKSCFISLERCSDNSNSSVLESEPPKNSLDCILMEEHREKDYSESKISLISDESSTDQSSPLDLRSSLKHCLSILEHCSDNSNSSVLDNESSSNSLDCTLKKEHMEKNPCESISSSIVDSDGNTDQHSLSNDENSVRRFVGAGNCSNDLNPSIPKSNSLIDSFGSPISEECGKENSTESQSNFVPEGRNLSTDENLNSIESSNIKLSLSPKFSEGFRKIKTPSPMKTPKKVSQDCKDFEVLSCKGKKQLFKQNVLLHESEGNVQAVQNEVVLESSDASDKAIDGESLNDISERSSQLLGFELESEISKNVSTQTLFSNKKCKNGRFKRKSISPCESADRPDNNNRKPTEKIDMSIRTRTHRSNSEKIFGVVEDSIVDHSCSLQSNGNYNDVAISENSNSSGQSGSEAQNNSLEGNNGNLKSRVQLDVVPSSNILENDTSYGGFEEGANLNVDHSCSHESNGNYNNAAISQNINCSGQSGSEAQNKSLKCNNDNFKSGVQLDLVPSSNILENDTSYDGFEKGANSQNRSTPPNYSNVTNNVNSDSLTNDCLNQQEVILSPVCSNRNSNCDFSSDTRAANPFESPPYSETTGEIQNLLSSHLNELDDSHSSSQNFAGDQNTNIPHPDLNLSIASEDLCDLFQDQLPSLTLHTENARENRGVIEEAFNPDPPLLTPMLPSFHTLANSATSRAVVDHFSVIPRSQSPSQSSVFSGFASRSATAQSNVSGNTNESFTGDKSNSSNAASTEAPKFIIDCQIVNNGQEAVSNPIQTKDISSIKVVITIGGKKGDCSVQTLDDGGMRPDSTSSGPENIFTNIIRSFNNSSAGVPPHRENVFHTYRDGSQHSMSSPVNGEGSYPRSFSQCRNGNPQFSHQKLFHSSGSQSGQFCSTPTIFGQAPAFSTPGSNLASNASDVYRRSLSPSLLDPHRQVFSQRTYPQLLRSPCRRSHTANGHWKNRGKEIYSDLGSELTSESDAETLELSGDETRTVVSRRETNENSPPSGHKRRRTLTGDSVESLEELELSCISDENQREPMGRVVEDISNSTVDVHRQSDQSQYLTKIPRKQARNIKTSKPTKRKKSELKMRSPPPKRKPCNNQLSKEELPEISIIEKKCHHTAPITPSKYKLRSRTSIQGQSCILCKITECNK